MTDIVDRLRGKYEVGPHLPNGQPEFGIRQFESTPINREAADYIEALRARLALADETMDEQFVGMSKLYDNVVLELLELRKEAAELRAANEVRLERGRAQAKKIGELHAALKDVMPFLPLGYAPTGRPGGADERNAALDAVRAKAEAALKPKETSDELVASADGMDQASPDRP